MAMSRSFGGTRFTTRSLMRISPAVMLSRPAIILRSVDLPQPDGPTRTTNSPSALSIETPWLTSVAPNDLRTSQTATGAMQFLPDGQLFVAFVVAFCSPRAFHGQGPYRQKG